MINAVSKCVIMFLMMQGLLVCRKQRSGKNWEVRLTIRPHASQDSKGNKINNSNPQETKV